MQQFIEHGKVIKCDFKLRSFERSIDQEQKGVYLRTEAEEEAINWDPTTNKNRGIL
jgi:hypothetical protein